MGAGDNFFGANVVCDFSVANGTLDLKLAFHVRVNLT